MRPEIDEEILKVDFINLFKGKLIGKGVCREVYECKIDQSLVIKVEKYAKDFNNVREWNIWQEVKNTEYSKYFAPCIDISPCGSVLLQKKCGKPHKKDFPDSLPSFMDQDTKYQNFGIYSGGLVMTDYGNYRITDNIKCDLKKIDWWDADS